MLKGHTKIELTDVETGQKTVVEDSNLFTNFLEKLVNNNAFSLLAINSGSIDSFFPLSTRALGGILLFGDEIAEDVNIFYPPIPPYAYAGDKTDAGLDPRLGTYNKTESKKLSNGYMHVWDFATHQGNGTLACLALTHYSVGNGFPSNLMYSLYSEGGSDSPFNTAWWSSFVCINKEGLFFIGWDTESNHIEVRRPNLIMDTLNSVNARFQSRYMEVEKIMDIIIENDTFRNHIRNGGILFRLTDDNKCIGYAHESNSSGNAVLVKIVVDVNTLEYSISSMTIPNVQLSSFGTSVTKYGAIRGKYLYCQKYNSGNTIYKINLDNVADIKTIDVPNISYGGIGYDSVTDYIIVGNRHIIFPNDEVFYSRDAMFSYSPPNTVAAIGIKELVRGNGYNYSYRGVVMPIPYIATINNISPVTKTAAQTMKITYTITDSAEVTLMGISMTTPPVKQRYAVGEALDLTGMTVTAVFSDGTRQAVTGECVMSPANGTILAAAHTEVNISYQKNGITRYTKCPLTVFELQNLTVVSGPTKTEYYGGEQLLLAGTEIRANYSDGTFKNVTELCTYRPVNGAVLDDTIQSVLVTYTEGLVTKTATLPLTVHALVLEAISITTVPKTAYRPNEVLDLTGIVVTAVYNSRGTKDVTAQCTFNPVDGTRLTTPGESAVMVTYTEGSVTKHASFAIYVAEEVVLASLTITANPTKMTYRQGDALDVSGISVTASYTDGTNRIVTADCTYEPANGSTLSTVGTQIIQVRYTEAGVTKTVTFNVTVEERPAVEIVPFATGTDAQIRAMVEAMDAGILSIADSGWQKGDERQVSLSAMAATGVGETHAAQTATLVLMDSQHYDLVEPTAGGDTKDHFVVGLKNSLKETGYMNPSNTNAGSWNSSKRRTWCNEVFANALPEDIKACFKKFKVVTAKEYNSTELMTSEDLFALFAEREIFDSRNYSNQTEWNALTQINYYKTAANRVKRLGDGGSTSTWWERSPYYGNSSGFCRVGSDGSPNYSYADGTYGLAPFGCL